MHGSHGNCDPACQKVIANSRFMGLAAERLCDVAPKGTPIHIAAQGVIRAADYLNNVVAAAKDAGLLSPKGDLDSWTGCKEAAQIAAYASAPVPSELQDTAAATLNKFAKELYANADSIIKGTMGHS